eukprot:EG_transcript_18785
MLLPDPDGRHGHPPGSPGVAPPSLLASPVELLRYLLPFVPVADLVTAVAGTCRRLRHFLATDRALHRALCAQERWPPLDPPRESGWAYICQQLALRHRLSAYVEQLRVFFAVVHPPCPFSDFASGMARLTPQKTAASDLCLPDNFAVPPDVREFFRLCDGMRMARHAPGITLDKLGDVLDSTQHWLEEQALQEEEEDEEEEAAWWQAMHRCPAAAGSPLWLPVGSENAHSTLFCCCDRLHPDFGCIASTSQQLDYLQGRFLAPSLEALLQALAEGVAEVLRKWSPGELQRARDVYADAFEMFGSCSHWVDRAARGARPAPAPPNP